MVELLDRHAVEVNRLVEEYRDRCLWFLRRDHYPATPDEQLRVLDHIERHADLAGYRRARTLKRWLSQLTSEPSAG